MKNHRLLFKDIFRNYLPLKNDFIRNRWRLIIGLASLLLVDLLQLLIPLIIKRAIDELTYGKSSAGILFQLGAAIMIIAFVIAVFRYLWRLALFGFSRIVEENLRNRLYAHLQTLSMSFYQDTKTGDVMARATNDINAVRMAVGMGMVAMTDGILMGLAAIAFMIHISPALTLISLLPAPVMTFLARIFTRRMASGFEIVQKTFSDLTEKVREAFAGIRVIKAYARETWEIGKVENEGRKYILENLKLARTLALFLPMTTIFTSLGLALVIWVGGRLTIFGSITTGDFVAFISYLNLLAWPMMAIGWVTNLVQRGSASMHRINLILETAPEIADPPQTKMVPRLRGAILFNDFSFRYPGQTTHALKGVSLSITAGQTMALVGRVGSGKTTLLQAIPRLYTIPKDTVFIDDIDITDLSLKELRSGIGFVTQESVIFSDTVRNNVIFGRAPVSEESLEAALKTAQVYDEVLYLEQGLDTQLGERGITLSGGQRQRLTIARALIADPQILILDDALSMVDTRTEETILNRILSLRSAKTNLIVSHRVSTIRRADLIVVLKNGEVFEMGDHGTLLARGMEYAKLYERQLLAVELEPEAGGNDDR